MTGDLVSNAIDRSNLLEPSAQVLDGINDLVPGYFF